jgi:vacuolar-type H+-ATPase subunit D/Vma8
LLCTTTSAAWQAADRHARESLLRAAILGGQQPIEAVTADASVDVGPHWNTVMGLRYPTEPEVTVPPPVPGAAAPGGMALAPAVTAYRHALVAAARHAAATSALRDVEREVATTGQRVRALERRWIPQLHAAQAAIMLQMAELEDADAVRRRRVTPHRQPL